MKEHPEDIDLKFVHFDKSKYVKVIILKEKKSNKCLKSYDINENLNSGEDVILGRELEFATTHQHLKIS